MQKKIKKEMIEQELFKQNKVVEQEGYLIKIDEVNSSLSKEAREFNDLAQKINKKRASIEKTRQQINELVQTYYKEVHPKWTELLEVEKAWALYIHEKCGELKIKKTNKKSMESSMTRILDMIIKEIEPDEILTKCYDYWNEQSFDELQQEETDFMLHFMVSTLGSRFGIDVSMDELNKMLDKNTPIEEKLRIEQSIREKTVEVFEREKEKTKSKKKTVKQLAKEEIQAREEEIKAKDLKSIYFTLVKLLHPDIEQDQEKRKQKEEIMKKVTVAYEQKDLYTLLKIEMEWIQEENRSIASMSEKKIKLYIKILKEQYKELQMEFQSIFNDPRLMRLAIPINYNTYLYVVDIIEQALCLFARYKEKVDVNMKELATIGIQDKTMFLNTARKTLNDYLPKREKYPEELYREVLYSITSKPISVK